MDPNNPYDWFYIGDNEFGFANLGFKDNQDRFYAQICFMLQQAVEKYLKGYLVKHKIIPKKVHDLGYLCKECSGCNKKFEDFIEDCELLSQYYIPVRYPIHYPIYSKEESKEAHEIAKKIINFIKKDLRL